MTAVISLEQLQAELHFCARRHGCAPLTRAKHCAGSYAIARYIVQ